MAEFKLGRIRFVYQGDWTAGRSYVVDDVVSIGGKSWICVINHTASTLFATDQTFNPTRWNLIADGTSWEGDWTPSTYYNVGGMIKYGGSVYICNESHTSATYQAPDYLGLEDDLAKWDIFATALEWKGDWATETRYKVRDIIAYGGTTYVCNTAHISAATTAIGLEIDQAKWDYFNQGIEYVGEWADAQRYKINDVVKYGASTWICIADHTSDTSFDETKFNIFVEGQQFENTWSDATDYQIGDIVTYGGNLYTASQNNINKNPVTETASWDLYTTGFNFRGDWVSTTAYRIGDVVRLGSYTYLAVDDSTGQVPPDLDFWTRLNQGTNWTRSDVVFTDIPTSTTGTGIGAEFNVVKTGTSYSLIQSAFGSGYQADDVLVILGTAIGGLSPANDITITVTDVTVIAPGEEALTVTHTGIAVTWVDGTNYVLGDLVFLGASTYICIDAHTSSLLNRPDADTTATYWNLFAAGSESAILTTEGDTYYFGAQGPTRLPIGTDGQVLRVKGGYPQWAYYGVINNLVYVAPTGTDSIETGWGLTIDKPWKTVRFACDQIREGYQNRNAKALLEKNKLFMMREVTNWITYTYSVSITESSASNNSFTAVDTANLTANMPIQFTGTVGGVVAGTKYFVKTVLSDTQFTISNTQGGTLRVLTTATATMEGSLSYDSGFCERDVGYLVDAVAFDLSHGGNGKSTIAAKAYYTPAGSAYINSNFGQQIVQTVAAYNYLKTLVDDVLSNSAVPVVYQTENALDLVVDQVIDTTLVAESGTLVTAQALLTIVTDGLLAGSGSAIPGAIFPNTTVSAKTGTFYEVLPIIIPNYTALTGDELRSTVISPQPAISALVNDKPKTISALERFKEIIPNLVANNTVVASTGNTEVQKYFYNNYSTSQGITSLNSNVNEMTDILANGLTAVPSYSLPTPTGGTGNASDAGFLNAARLVNANRAFIVAELSAWIYAQIAGNIAPFNTGFTYGGTDQEKCERDVGYITDALRFDLTYGGNLATVIAGRAYYTNGVYVGDSASKARALAVQLRIKDIIDNIVTGDTAGWTETPANALVQDVTGTAGSSTAATFAQDRIQEIHDAIDTGTSPTTIAPDITWTTASLQTAFDNIQVAKTTIQGEVISWINNTYPLFLYNAVTCSRDVGYIVDALAYDMIFNSNFLSAQSAMSYYRGLTSTGVVLDNQLRPTLGIIGYVGAATKEYASGLFGTVGSSVSADRITSSVEALYDVLNNGIESAPTEIITDPVGFDVNFFNARAQIAQNYAFIKADVSQYLANTQSAVWTALGATGQAKCQRDIGYILDAIRYDLTYGGNTQSLIVGSSYYSYINLVIAETELTATLAAYTHLKSIIDNIVLNSAYTPVSGNTTPRNLAGTGGDSTAATFAQDRVQNIIDWISNGTAPATVLPDTSWVNTSLVKGFNELQARKAEIQSDGLQYVHKFFQELTFNEATCSRDIGIMIDAIGYDMMFNSNFASVIAGKSYYRALAGTQLVLNSQKSASLGLINFLKYKAKSIAVGGAVAKIATTIDDIVDSIHGGATPRFLWPSFTGVDAENFAAAKLIWENSEFIKAETIQYITDNYPAVEYSKYLCARDIGYIIDAVRYDLTYGGNVATRQAALAYYSQLTDLLQIDSNDKTATLAAYANLKTIVQDIANGGLSTYTALQNVVAYATGTSGDSTSASVVGTLIQNMIDYITDPVANPITESLPSTAWVDPNLVAQDTLLQSNKTIIQNQITTFIGENYPNLVYDSVTCQRDIGYILDAIGYDLMFGSNYRSIKAGMSYYQAQASKVIADQKRATLQSFRYLKELVADIVFSNPVSLNSARHNMDLIINILDKGVGWTPETVGTLSYMNDIGTQQVAEILRINKTFLENEATAWIRSQYSSSVIETAGGVMGTITTGSSHNFVVGDPVEFTSPVINTLIVETATAGNLITLRSVSGIVPGMLFTVVGTGSGTLTAGIYYVITVDSVNKQVTVSSTFSGPAVDPGNSTQLSSVTVGGVFGGVTAGEIYYVASTPTTTTFTVKANQNDTTTVGLLASEGVMTAQYAFDDVACKRDMGAYVDALVYDLQYPGNYKSTFAALLYNNAVGGSERSDMFWVSNSTGLRNCTLRGLLGDLTAKNDFGTQRPTAGAFVALNPGFGPNDSNVWVSARSHYSQNVTMFGSGCTGAKIDSALHAGGNKSMVKNDFTTIISDGIGVWCTGADSLTELVSVFNYYGYAGYLAELGGRIRATNGNSSYGTYGVIAEGVASTETPIYGQLDNRAAQAQVTNTVTDGVMEILRMEFGNAGSGYTNVEYTVNGSGYNVVPLGDEFRDGAVFETTIIDLDDDNGVGGTNYVTAANGAQTGDNVSITLAATDQALSAAYLGMRVQITAGTGVGQYANILTYETGSKFARVFKDSFNLLTVTGSTTTVLQVANTATLYVGMPIYLSADTAGVLTANTLYYVESVPNTTTFTVELTPGAGAITGLTATSGQTITLYAAGWDHTVPGTTIETGLDLTTTYIIEPRINYSAPGYTATARTLATSAAWDSLTFGDNAYVAVAGSGTTTNYSANGTTWANAGALSASASWTDVVYGGGFGATATAVVGGLGGRGAVLRAVLGVANTTGAATADQVARVEIIDGGQGYETPPVIVFTPVTGGTGATATCAVLDGKISSVTITIPGSGYLATPTVSVATDRVTHIIVNSWGRNYFSTPQVTLVGGGYTTQATVKGFGISFADSTLTNAGVSRLLVDNQGAGYTSIPTVEIVDTSAKYVAIANGAGDNCYTTRAGLTTAAAWTAGTTTGKTDLTSLAYGNGVYVAVGGASSAVSSTNGNLWLARTIPTLGAGSYSSVTYGNGVFVAISTGSNATAYSFNGNAWSTGGVLPATTTWTSVAYGNGRFVAIASGSRSVAYSLDKGVTWTASASQLPSSQTWSKVSYGDGLFFAVARGTNVCAVSTDGVYWTARAMPGASTNWNSVAFGNINSKSLWTAISNTTGTTAASIQTGAQATGRVKVASGIVTEVRMLEPGSGYPKGTVSATAVTTNLITVDNTVNLVNLQPIEFFGTDSGGLVNEVTYYVIGSTITSTEFKVAATIDDAIAGTAITLINSTPSMTYRAGPIVTVTDPNNIANVGLRVRLGDGALGNPSFTDRGADNSTATTDVSGDGYSDLFQVSTFVNVYNLSERPTAGANVEFASIPGAYYKLVTVTNFVESQDYPGTYTATFQLNPGLTTLLAPKHGDLITTRIKYSQVRLTGHDFLYIGTGGFEKTNYPYVDITTASQDNQAQFSAGGRVFFTSTDQDGNFNVGNLFGVQQATGTATLNASAFNLSGLNSLQLGSVELGIGSAIITQFSTDPFFTADSDNVVPTQRAIRAYITAQIGGGQSSLNVNTLTSGVIFIAGNSISTTTGAGINVTAKMNFTGGIDGAPVALGYFLTR